MKPRIAITADEGGKPAAYMEAVRKAGGTPVVLAPADAVTAETLPSMADAILLSGGDDLDAALWGEAMHLKAVPMDPRRQRADLAIIALADARRMPVLGICLGCQEMAVARGGRLIQHLPDEPAATLDHGRGGRRPAAAGRPRPLHTVTIEPDSGLARIVGLQPIDVNSTHHQAVRSAGRGMRIVARSPDGIIEAIEDPTPGRFFLAVQWHPEDLTDEPRHLALFEALCRAAGPS